MVESTVPGGDVDLALPEADAPVVVPARPHAVCGVSDDVRVVLPEHLAGGPVDGAHDVHAADEVEDPVDDERGGR